jgi:predicted nucleic acid-binding Zn ribbon protein
MIPSFTQEARLCLACGKPVRGRADKKCCNDYCRNVYNNQRKPRKLLNDYVKSVNSILIRNRSILESLMPGNSDCTRTSVDKLRLRSFQFSYFTHQQTIQNGKTCYCCYEYGYLPLNKNRYLVMRLKEE